MGKNPKKNIENFPNEMNNVMNDPINQNNPINQNDRCFNKQKPSFQIKQINQKYKINNKHNNNEPNNKHNNKQNQKQNDVHQNVHINKQWYQQNNQQNNQNNNDKNNEKNKPSNKNINFKTIEKIKPLNEKKIEYFEKFNK